jgi:uncharacterized membrane protein YoaK (UPF0700 family)
MLYGNESIATYNRSNVIVWMVMAFQGGSLNMAGFLTCHRFVSHVTGFATFFGNEVTKAAYGPAFGMLVVPLFFMFGSMISGELVDNRMRLHLKPKYYIVFGIIFALIFIAWLGGVSGFFGDFGGPLESLENYILLGLLCLTCGIQNGMIASVSRFTVRTTHLTGITTDLGIGLIRFFHREKFSMPIDDEIRANLLRIGIIFFFGCGSIVSGFAFKYFRFDGFLLPITTSGGLFVLIFYFQIILRRYRKQG